MRRAPAGRDFRRDFASFAKAGVNEAHVAQPGQRIRIEMHPRRLADDFTVPAEPEPLKILDYAPHKGLAAPAGVDIFYPEYKAPPARARQIMRQQDRKSVV